MVHFISTGVPLIILLAARAIAYQTITSTGSYWTVTETVVPTQLAQAIDDPGALYAVAAFDPTLTSIAESEALRLVSELETYLESYIVTKPPPAVLTNPPYDLPLFFSTAGDNTMPNEETLFEISEDIEAIENDQYMDASEAAEIRTSLAEWDLHGYPKASSKIAEYLTALANYDAEPFLAEGSIVSKALSVTTAPPSWVTQVQDSVPSNTAASGQVSSSSSKAGVAGLARPTAGPGVVINAVVAAAGMVGVALL